MDPSEEEALAPGGRVGGLSLRTMTIEELKEIARILLDLCDKKTTRI